MWRRRYSGETRGKPRIRGERPRGRRMTQTSGHPPAGGEGRGAGISELVAEPELRLTRREHAIPLAVSRDRVSRRVLLAAVETREVVPVEDIEGLRAHAEPAVAAHRHALGEAQVDGPVHVAPRRRGPDDPVRAIAH